MDITVPKKELLQTRRSRCQGVADKKSTMPALSNVLLSVSGPSELRVAATDLYLAVSGTCDGCRGEERAAASPFPRRICSSASR